MARWPKAIWQPLLDHDGRLVNCGGVLRPKSVCLHHQAGNGNPYHVYLRRGVSAHFWIPRSGRPVQHVDTSIKAWHGMTMLNAYAIGVETEGCTPPHDEPLNEHQLELFAELMAWANRTHGIPLQLSETVSERGLNYHRCRGGVATACPCAVRVNQRAEIIRRARGKPATVPPAQPPTMHDNRITQRTHADHKDADVYTWQERASDAGYELTIDGFYGPQSAGVCNKIKAVNHLHTDGILGKRAWAATWRSPRGAS